MAIFLLKFINLANKVNWTDSVKILALESLHRDIKHQLTFKSRSDIPTSYNAFLDYQLHKNNTIYHKNSGNNGNGHG